MAWYRTADMLPEQGEIVDTKVDDWRGCRNEQRLKFSHNLWWIPDGSIYVYYNPTHWKYSWM